MGRVLETRAAWEGNPTHEDILTVQWGPFADGFALVIVNLAGHRSQCHVPLVLDGFEAGSWKLTDRLGPERWTRSADALRHPGLYLDLAPRACQVFSVDAAR